MGIVEEYKEEERRFEAREMVQDALWEEFEMAYSDGDLKLDYDEDYIGLDVTPDFDEYKEMRFDEYCVMRDD